MFKADCSFDKYKEIPYCQYSELRPCKYIISKELEGKEFESVLDVGTQWGECLMAIQEKFPGKKLVGIDINEDFVNLGKEITGLDLRVMDASNMDFAPSSFDVVCTEALFCMLPKECFKKILKKIIITAKKYVILVELTIPTGIAGVQGGRMGASWTELFSEYDLVPEIKPIPKESWGVSPWLDNGRIITIKI